MATAKTVAQSPLASDDAFEARVRHVLAIMGLASANDIALEIPTGEPLAVRRRRAEKVLKRIGVAQTVGGQRAIARDPAAEGGLSPAIPSAVYYRIKPPGADASTATAKP